MSKELIALVESKREDFGMVLPAHLKIETELRKITAMIARDDKLSKCSRASVMQCLMTTVSLGLTPNTLMGAAYLIPYQNKGVLECQFQIGYRGLIELARRSGNIATIEAHVVYSNDVFECDFGTDSKLVHRPNFLGDRGQFVCVYAVAKFVDGGYQLEVMSKGDVEKIKSTSQGGSSPYSPWAKHYDEMAKKTVVKRLCKYLPLSEQMEKAIVADNESEKQLVDAQSGEVIKEKAVAKKNMLKDKIAAKIAEIPKDDSMPIYGTIDVNASSLFEGVDL
jgi:recombination protein RecT